jgi:DNA-binding transcriptional LysR family regulator
MLTPFDLEIFVALADSGTLTAAARMCGMTRATITRHLEALEAHLATPLVNRTTRELALTEAGQVFLGGARDTLNRLREAEAAVHQLGGRPRGRLRIACPIIRIAQIIAPLVTTYAAAYPEVDVQVHLSSEPVNPLVDGFDLAVHMGLECAAALIARCLIREPYLLVASPRYLQHRGIPRSVAELAQHDCIVSVRANGVHEPWPLSAGGELAIAKPRLLANAASLVRIGALEGMGIAFIARSLIFADLASGALVPLLENEVRSVVPVSLVYAAGSKDSPKIRSFVEHAVAWVDRLSPTMSPETEIVRAEAVNG